MRKNTPEQVAQAKIKKVEYTKKWQLEHPDKTREANRRCYKKHENDRRASREERKEKFKRYNLYRYYGLSLEQYNEMLEQQGGGCAICGGVNDNGRRLAVDHDHETDAIRGLLCSNCNFAIGLIKENTRIAQGIIDYIKKSKPNATI